MGKHILGPVAKRTQSRHGVTFLCPPNRELSIRWRPLTNRDYYYGFINGTPFSSTYGLDRDHCVKALKKSLKIYAVMLACFILIMIMMWGFFPKAEVVIPLAALMIACAATYAVASSIASWNTALAMRMAWWLPIFAGVGLATVLDPGILTFFGVLLLYDTRALRPMADVLGIEPWDIFGVRKGGAQAWKRRTVIYLNESIECKGCGNYLSGKFYPEGTKCPACWNTKRLT